MAMRSPVVRLYTPSIACPRVPPWNTERSELATSSRSRSSSASMPTDETRSGSVTSGVTRPSS